MTRAVDGVCKLGHNYQVKSKVVSGSNFNFNITELDTTSFTFLVVVFFDREYNPLKILRIESTRITNDRISVTSSFINSGIEVIDKSEIRIPSNERQAINDFAKAYNGLIDTEIIRSRRIVGDIGEFYACRQLEFDISDSLSPRQCIAHPWQRILSEA